MKKKSKAAKIVIFGLIACILGTMAWRIAHRPQPSEAVSISNIRQKNGMPVTTFTVTSGPWEYWLPLYGTVRTSGLSEVFATEAEYVTSLLAEVGDTVKKGQTLATLDSKKAAEKVQAADAKFNELSMKYERTKELQKAGGYSKQDVEGAYSQYREAQSSLQQLKTELSRHRVVSPINGVVMQRNAEIGLLAGSGRSLFVIGDPKLFEIEIDISPKYIAGLSNGEKAQFLNGHHIWQDAIVKRVDPMADSVTGLYTVILAVSSDTKLNVGASVEAKIRIENEANAISIPYETVRETAGSTRVYVCSGDAAQERMVAPGRTNEDGFTRIISGLKAGEKIILKGADRMYNGAKIWIQES